MLPLLKTGLGPFEIYMFFDGRSGATVKARIESLGKREFELKLPETTGITTAGTRGLTAEGRAEGTSE